MIRRGVAVAGLLAVCALPLAAAPTPVLAYTGGCGTGNMQMTTSSSVVSNGQQFTVTATATDCSPSPGSSGGTAGNSITFSSSDPCVTFDKSNTTTDANGVATTTASLGPSCPCQVTLTATNTTTGATANTTVRRANCLPFTSGDVAPAAGLDTQPIIAAMLVAAGLFLVLAGLAFRLRRKQA